MALIREGILFEVCDLKMLKAQCDPPSLIIWELRFFKNHGEDGRGSKLSCKNRGDNPYMGGCIGRELETRAVKSKLRNSKAHKFKGCPRYSYFFHQ